MSGLDPTVSDLCIMAREDGLPYTVLINEVLQLALNRYAMESRGAWYDSVLQVFADRAVEAA